MPIEIPQHRDDRCPFCSNIIGSNQSAVVVENEAVYSFINPRMAGLGHTLVIPKRHAPTVLDLEPAEALAIMDAVHRIANAMAKAFDPAGLNIYNNNGITAGQTVAHFHVHIVPSYPGDEPGRIFNTREIERSSYEERAEIAARIVAHLA